MMTLWTNPIKRRVAEKLYPEGIKAENFWWEADYRPALDGNGWIGVARDGTIFRLEPGGILTRLTAPRCSAAA